MKRCCVSLLTVGLLLTIRVSAQYPFANAEMFDKEKGLPANTVRAIAQDKSGFMWFGTVDGLCRFDGSQFHVYRHDPQNPDNSLVHDNVTNLMVDGNDLWISTRGGVSVLDMVTDQFNNYRFNLGGQRVDAVDVPLIDFGFLFRDRDNIVWVGTYNHGLGRYDHELDSFEFFLFSDTLTEHIVNDPSRLQEILFIEQDRNREEVLWIGTVSGLLEMNKESYQVKLHYFPFEDKRLELAANAFRRLYHHHDGLLYCGTWNADLNIFNPADETLEIINWSSKVDRPMLGPISDIRTKNDDEIWITAASGLVAYHTTREEVTVFYQNDEELNQRFGAHYVDRDGGFWAISYRGLYHFNPILQQFAVFDYGHLNRKGWGFARKILTQQGGRVLSICPQDASGLFHLDRTDREWTISAVPSSFLDANGKIGGYDMEEDPWGSWTIATTTSLMTYKPESDRFTAFPYNPDFRHVLLNAILWDSQERLWVGSYRDGIKRWDSRSGQEKHFDLNLGDQSVPGLEVRDLFEDRKGNIWIARNDGHSVYLASQDTLIHFRYKLEAEKTLPECNNFAEDDNGKIWLSSEDGWSGFANVEKPDEGLLRKFYLKNLYPRITRTLFVRYDGDDHVWYLGNEYLVRMNTTTFQSQILDFAYGLQDPAFWYFDFLPSGEMVFGMRNRIAICQPSLLRKNTTLPIPYVTGINIREQPDGSDSVAHHRRSLNLEPRENFFSLDFSALSFTMPKENQFRYRLKNFDESWIDARDRRTASFTNVPSGSYVFQLQAANNEGMWNPNLYELPITIATPWWQIWWVRVLGVVMVLALMVVLYRARISKIRREERIRVDFQRKLANIEMSALRAQMNPHFIFNCLNSIETYVLSNENVKAANYLNDFARLIRLILQHSRAKYIPLESELEALELYLQMESLRFIDRFVYQIKVDPNVDTLSTEIPPMLLQPYAENAIWHGLMHQKKVGQLWINIQRDNGMLKCTIEDNGIGRNKSKEINQKKKMVGKKSVGMSITADRIHLLNELYETETKVQIYDLKDPHGHPSGTRVEIKIPIV